MCNALGIINFEDATCDIQGLQDYRPVSAMSLLGRYRIIDFVLSNMTNSGIDDIQVYVKEKPRSLFEHLGSGQHYNINQKRGRLHILYGEQKIMSEVYNSDITNFMQNMQFIEESTKPYVIIAPSYFIYRIDFNEVLEAHKKGGEDITLLYHTTDDAKEEYVGCDTVTIDKDRRITDFEENRGKFKARNISLECYVMSKKVFIELVNRAANTSSLYWFKDILREVKDELVIKGCPVNNSYMCCINSLAAYFRCNMELSHLDEARRLFSHDWPIHTMTNDSCPTQYSPTAKVKSSILANGCYIEGTVENSVIGRNVTIKKGAVVKNCVICPGAYISDGAKIDHVVVDKAAIVHHVKKLVGTNEAPIYVKRRDRI